MEHWPSLAFREVCSLMFSVRLLSHFEPSPGLWIVTSGTQDIGPQRRTLATWRATLLGLARVIPQEFPGLVCRCIDIESGVTLNTVVEGTTILHRILSEIIDPDSHNEVAYRGSVRWAPTFIPVGSSVETDHLNVKDQGVYLITGGLGRVGLALAEELATRTSLHARSPFPAGYAGPRIPR